MRPFYLSPTKPDRNSGHRLELSLELGIEILLVLVPLGRELMGLPPNVPLGITCWGAAALIAVRMFWIWERTDDLPTAIKLFASVLFLFVVVLLARGSVQEALLLQHPLSEDAQNPPPISERFIPKPPSIEQVAALPLTKPQIIESVEANTTVALEFAGRDELQLELADTTEVPADKPKYWFAMEDVTNCFVWPAKQDECQPLPLQTQTYDNDYINGMERLGPYDVLSLSPSQVARQHVKSGDVILGLIGSTCFNCLRARRYYVYFKVGDGGWYCPLPEAKAAEFRIPGLAKTIADEELQRFLNIQAPERERIPIPMYFDHTRKTGTLP